MPSHRAEGSHLPKGNPRPRFLKREKIKHRRSHYWDLAVKDINQRDHRRTWRIMRLAEMLRQGWTPSSLKEEKFGEGTYWRAVHLHHRMR